MDCYRRSSSPRIRLPVHFRDTPLKQTKAQRRKSRRASSPSSSPPEASTADDSETVQPPIDPFTYEHDPRSSSLPPEMFTYAPSCASSDTGTRDNTPFPDTFSRESTPNDQEPTPVVVKRESTHTSIRELSSDGEDTQTEEPAASSSRESAPTLTLSQETPELKAFEEGFLGF